MTVTTIPVPTAVPAASCRRTRGCSTWVPKILASPAFKKDGLLIVTFDEAEAAVTTADATRLLQRAAPYPNVAERRFDRARPGRRPDRAVLLSPFIKPGSTSATPYNHFALLCSMERPLRPAAPGYAAQPGLQCFGKDVYTKAWGRE